MRGKWKWMVASGLGLVLVGAVLAWSGAGVGQGGEGERAESERKVGRGEVPEAAWSALKELAAGAEMTGCSEEIEHGHKFFEGSWKAAGGRNVDALVTPSGDLVEIEERVDAEKVPAAVRAAARKAAGKGNRVGYEKKTVILYEVKFRKGDRRHELLLTPDGRRVEEEVESGGSEEDEG